MTTSIQRLVPWLSICRRGVATPNVKQIALSIAILIAAILSTGAALQDYFVGDLWLAAAIQETTSAPWEAAMKIVTFIGRAPVLAAISLPPVGWLLWKGHRLEASAVFVALLSFGTIPVLKMLVGRPRPTDDLVAVWGNHQGLSFPSGHAFDSVVLFGLLYYLAPLLVASKPAVQMVRASSLSLILLIGVSRVYLGAHWPSDVVGGFLYGTIVLTVLIGFHRWLSRGHGQR